jgi:hypothetical protein
MKQAVIKCPLRDREPHTARKPERLDGTALKHIEHQITRNNYDSLPHLGIVKRFHRCLDCYAVWVTGSVFEMATEATFAASMIKLSLGGLAEGERRALHISLLEPGAP